MEIAKAGPGKQWGLTEAAFLRLLRWLDEGTDSAGERYLEMRRRLAAYFDRKNCLSPDDLADETLNRVARKLEEKGAITDIGAAQYCYVTAKFVFQEYLRQSARSPTGVEFSEGSVLGVAGGAGPASRPEETAAKEKLLTCLERCLEKLRPADRELILEYYQGNRRAKIERRQALAERLGLTLNALSIRACRIRDKLEACVRECAEAGE